VREWLGWSFANIAAKTANAHCIESNGSVNGPAAHAKPLRIRLRFVPYYCR
jgi:hypothetical protein